MNWKNTLQKLVNRPEPCDFPLLVYHAAPPASSIALPADSKLRSLYEITDGGFIGGYNFNSLAELLDSVRWHGFSENFFENDSDNPFRSDRYACFGFHFENALLHDSLEDRILVVYLDPIEVSETEQSFDEFMESVFDPSELGEADQWRMALQQLES